MGINETRDSSFTDNKLAVLAPPTLWQPDAMRARTLLAGRRGSSRKDPPVASRWRWALTAAAVLAAICLLPASRSYAQRIWEAWKLSRVEVMRVDFDALPVHWSLTGGYIDRMATLAEAEQRAGFPLVLPDLRMTQGEPQLAVMQPASASMILSASEFRRALEDHGVFDLVVPSEWDHAAITYRFGPTLIAEWGQELTILEAPEVSVTAPNGLDLARLSEAAFRVGGLDSPSARRLSLEFVAQPSLLLGVPQDEPVTLRQVSLPRGEAILLEDADERHHLERTTIVWTRQGRLFAISTSRRAEEAKLIANSLDR